MTPAQRKQALITSKINFKRMRIGGRKRSGNASPEFTHEQINDAIAEFLNSGGKIEKCYAVSASSFNTGQPEVDNFLMGGLK